MTAPAAPNAPIAAAPEPLDALPGLPRGPDGPVFTEPWQASVFAITLSLHRAGLFAWTEWAQALGARLADAAAAGGPTDGSDYWLRWLDALEALAQAKGAAEAGALRDMAQAWRDAAEATPHGAPIELPGRAPRRG
ncbi:MAG: nitrile hydratase accessory protein [Pseudomonadota bacterium]